MNDLAKSFSDATAYGITYLQAKVKPQKTLVTMSDATQFKKRKANNQKDNGEYAAKLAISAHAQSNGCAETCLYSQTGNRPIVKGATATSVTGQCAPCETFFKNLAQPATVPVSSIGAALAGGGTLPPAGISTADAVAPYPDQDGTPRVGRPPDPTTTTTLRYYAPPPIGVVGLAAPRCVSIGVVAMVVFVASFAVSM